MFLPQARVWALNNPKTAGTSLRWWMLAAAGIDVAKLTRDSLWRESSPGQVVWDQTAGIPFAWENLSEDDKFVAESGEDVIRIVPVRHPVSRVLATWSSKYLSAEPGYEANLPSWMPRVADSLPTIEAVAASFEEFVTAIAESDEPWTSLNAHNWPQHLLLQTYLDSPHLLVRQESLQEDLTPVRHRLEQAFGQAGPLPRLNISLLAAHPDVLTEGALEAIYSAYSGDFDVFGYQRSAPSRPADPPSLGWINDVRGRNRRYGVVQHAATRLERKVNSLQAANEDLRSQGDALRRQLDESRHANDRLRHRVASLRDRLETSRKELRSLRRRNHGLDAEATHLHKELHDITTSRSWRVTAPARTVAGALQRMRRA